MPESILAGLNEETTQLELLGNATLLLAQILDRQARQDGAKRLAVRIEAMDGNMTLTTVTTVGSVNAFGNKPTDAIPTHMGNAGSMHLYNNITVS